MKERVYLSGPMRGKPSLNQEMFKKTTVHLRHFGFEVLNPHELDGDGMLEKWDAANEMDRREITRRCLRRDLKLILGPPKVNRVVVLDGWERSLGARAEVFMAWAVGIPVYGFCDGKLEKIEGADAMPFEQGDSPRKVSGEIRECGTGAQRDSREGKGRYDLISPIAMRALALALEEGVNNPEYGARNWEKGMPLSWFLDSAIRHLFQTLAGMEDEDHEGHAMFNVMAGIHTREMIRQGKLPAELYDLPH